MALDLDSLRGEIQAHLESSEFAVFHGFVGLPEKFSAFWNTEERPDFREFLAVAEKVGVRMVVFNHHRIPHEDIEQASQDVKGMTLTKEQSRGFERRLREIGKYEGFTCSLDLSFASEGRLYHYRLQTDWYGKWLDLLSELDSLDEEFGEEYDDDPIPGFFSTN